MTDAPSSLAAAQQEIFFLRHLLKRCLPFVQSDADMMDAIVRYSPLDAASQAVHNNTEWESQVLLRDLGRSGISLPPPSESEA